MTEPKNHQEIDRRLDELAAEYTKTPKGDARRTEIENEISALCLQRYMLPESKVRDRKAH